MSADNNQTIDWYVDLLFAIHKVMRSHIGVIMTLGNGAIRSSTKSKMIEVDDTILKALQINRFIESQGHKVDKNIIVQDHISAINLELNGKTSTSTPTNS